jgi:hypothetical protein
MTDKRLIAADALFTVFYIGLAAALVGTLAAIGIMYAAGVELDGLHVSAAAAGVAGLFVLPLLPRLYRLLIGQPFNWRQNTVLGGIVDN